MPSTSSVPEIQFTAAGVVIPEESAILTGVQADQNAAFGGGLNPALETPQGQLASSLTAIIGDKNAEFLYYVNQVDPQYAEDRFQDAIGRIYFLERKGATSTAVQCTLTGVYGTAISVGTLAQDTSGNIYQATDELVIGITGEVTGEFQNITAGPIPCAAGTLTKVYQAISGWDAITNAADGIPGTLVESRAEFEYRRQNSVALNGRGTPQAVYAAVFNVDNVTDVYVLNNPNPSISFTGAISGTTLTVSAIASGKLTVGSVITGDTVAADTWVEEILTGSGGLGTYRVSVSQTVTSRTLMCTSTVCGATNYALSNNSIYVAAVGGISDDIGAAIWSKLDAGCAMNGNTTVEVSDTSYLSPQPTYDVTFNRPDSLPILFEVNIIDDPSLPSDIVVLTKAAIIARFNGTDGTYRERIGGTIYSSRYYPSVASLADYVPIDSILIGTVTANATKVEVGIDKAPTLSESDITVNIV